MQKIVVMSVGGSLINPGQIQTDFLKHLKEFIHKSEHKFIIICGGGQNARTYAAAAKEFGVKGEDLDYIGIQATLLNAELLRRIFNAPKTLQKPKKTKFEKVLLGAGWLPGCSTDYDAVLWAKLYKTKEVINLTNTDYVYDKDPKEQDAKPFKKISWEEYTRLISSKWTAGLSTPFDPIASKEAQKNRIKAVCINGKNLGELQKYFEEKNFTGTIIE